MASPSLIFALWLAAVMVASAQMPAPAGSWDEVRKAQPPGLQLKLTLPKDHFYQGEVINAELEFSNTSDAPYHLWVGNYDRSGRIPDIAFRAEDAAGHAVRDPLAWYFQTGGVGGGLGGFSNLGDWKITLPVNQWLSFDKPGVYTIYAWSNRLQKGPPKDPVAMQGERVPLVSDKIQVTIDLLPPDQEKQIIASTKGNIALGGEVAESAMQQLRYLGTPASQAELVPLLANPRLAFDVSLGLYASPDTAQAAADLLAAVSAGKVSLRADITNLYARLKTHDLMAGFDPAKTNPQDAQQLGRKIMQATQQANDEITAAALKASGGNGDAYLSVLMTKFQQNSRDPATRAELAQHQLELSDQQADGPLEEWDIVGGEEFLPLARKMAGAPAYAIAGLKALMKAKPDEALELLKNDARQPKSNFFTPRRGGIQAHRLLLSPAPDPALDATLRAKLQSGSDLENTAFYVQEFASPALVPAVTAVYQQHEGMWACEIQKYFLWYLLRCDPKTGADSLSRALAARAETGCYKTLLGDVLEDRWDDAVLPVVIQALNDPEPQVALGAAKALGLHGDSAAVDKALAALARMDAAAAPSTSMPGMIRRGQPAMIAQQMLDHPNAHFTPDQQKRLEALATGH